MENAVILVSLTTCENRCRRVTEGRLRSFSTHFFPSMHGVAEAGSLESGARSGYVSAMRRQLTISLAALLAAFLTWVGSASAQYVPTLSDDARVSLITILPGEDVYSTFGHSALRVVDRELGIDEAYNFGTFDFGSSVDSIAGFVARFTYGDLNYNLTIQPGSQMIDWYWRELRRASIEQTLALTPSERQALYQHLRITALPENRYYQYDFFFDNCATRLLDAVELAVGTSLSFGAEPPGKSLRELLDPYLPGVPWTDFGMNLGLGLPSDRQATAREATFLPELLMDHLATGVIDRNGEATRLVARTDTLTGGPDMTWDPDPAPPWPAIALWILFAGGMLLTIADLRAGRPRRRVVDAVFFGVLGIAGLVAAFLWFISLHDVTDGNLNLAWALPTHLIVAVAIARYKWQHWMGTYMAVTAVLSLILLAGFPFWPQRLPAALIPLLLLIVVRAGSLVRMQLSPSE